MLRNGNSLTTETVKNSSFGIVLNVFIASEEKLARLVKSIKLLTSLRPLEFSVRIRGPLQDAARRALLENCVGISEADVILGDEGLPWIEATLQQLDAMESSIVLLTQEDHWLIDNQAFQGVLSDFSLLGAQFCHLTFFPQVSATLQACEEILGSQQCHFLSEINLPERLNSMELARLYAITLVGLFSRDYLRNLLLSPLDLPLRYKHSTPFVFERKFHSKQIYPVRICFPKYEVLACVDDDHGVQGYSLRSRGLAENSERVISHRGPFLDRLTKFVSVLMGIFPATIVRQLVAIGGIPIWLINNFSYRKYLHHQRNLKFPTLP